MDAFRNLKTGSRLALGFTALIALIIAMAMLGVLRLRKLDDATEFILHDRFPKVQLASTIENEVNRQARALRTAIITKDEAARRRELKKIEESAPLVAAAVEKLDRSVTSPEGRAALSKLEETRQRFKARERELLALIEAGRADDAGVFLVDQLLPVQDAYLAGVGELVKTQSDSMEAAGAQARATTSQAITALAVLGGIAGLFAVAVATALTRSITRPIIEAVHLAEKVADGDLGASVQVDRRDEAGQLLEALNRMTARLKQVVGSVRAGSDSIATGSGQIAAGNADLSQRTEEQASNLQQTAASMEQLHSTVAQNAESARRAAELASAASEQAENGGRSVEQLVRTMDEISQSSRRIADIIGVIDGIAFQTNILALNAAVEAARAGEQGRGFAVVAGEVRTLAHRSAEAAREIKSLIGSSVETVEAGQAQMAEAGAAMNDIVQRVKHVAQFVHEITTAATEQIEGIGQVNNAVSQLDQVTQQNAALVEESAAAADSLKQQADRLVEAVNVFRL